MYVVQKLIIAGSERRAPRKQLSWLHLSVGVLVVDVN